MRVLAWAGLHPKVHNHDRRGTRRPLPIVVGTLILVEVERLPRGERRREPRVLWLWWHGPQGTTPDLDLIWRSYVRRFDLEHTFRFLKQSMGWTTPRVRHPEQADLWSWLVVAAYTQLRLVRARVANLRLPSECRCDRGRLTPVGRASEMVVRFIAENLVLDQLGSTRRIIYTVLWIGVLGTLGVSLAYLLVLFPICMRTSYRRVGSDVGRGCLGLVRDLSEPKILRQKLQEFPAWNRIHVHK